MNSIKIKDPLFTYRAFRIRIYYRRSKASKNL